MDAGVVVSGSVIAVENLLDSMGLALFRVSRARVGRRPEGIG